MNRTTKITQKTYQKERQFFYAGVSLVLILFAAYVYFVSAAIAHVVVRKELTQEIKQTEAHISELETAYITAQNSVTIDMALARGFEKNEEKVFIEKAHTALVLSQNDTR